MQQTNLDASQLIVSWNRSEQELMKKYLMQCAYFKDWFCFGDFIEVCQLHKMLVKHGIKGLTWNADYKNNNNFAPLVNEIKIAIQKNLKYYVKNLNQYYGKKFNCSTQYFINNDNETKFLTSFAMAVQDTKKRCPFFPGGCIVDKNNTSNPNCYKIYFNNDSTNYITLAKVKLFSLATQLTRIGLNCKTTIHHSNTMKSPTTNVHDLRNVHLIDTNNFLDFDLSVGQTINMNKLGIGMDGVKYYVNLYRKLFDFALQKEIQDGEKTGNWKIPEFVIPLGSAWGTRLNGYIFTALNQVLGENWNRGKYQGNYGRYISVKVIDADIDGNGHYKPFEKAKYMKTHPTCRQNLVNVGIVNWNRQEPLFNDPKIEHYMIMASDHFAFLGNEAMYNGRNGGTIPWSKDKNNHSYRDDSLESANMKTDFFKFYGQGQNMPTGYNWQYPQRCGFHPNNGAWIMNPERLNMPQYYLLHCNYQGDKLYQMSENQQIQQNYNYKNINFQSPTMFMSNNVHLLCCK